MTQNPRVYLLQIRDTCQRITECARLKGRADIQDTIVLDAVCRNLQFLGDAAERIGPEFRNAHPELPWREMIETRHMLISAFEGTDADAVWGVMDKDIPPIATTVRRMLLEL